MPLLANRGRGAMAREHLHVIWKGKEHGLDGSDQRVVVPAWQVGSPDRPSEQRVAGKQASRRFANPPDLETHAARRVAGCVVRQRLVTAEQNRYGGLVIEIHRWQPINLEPETEPLLHRRCVHREFGLVEVDRRAERRLRPAHP